MKDICESCRRLEAELKVTVAALDELKTRRLCRNCARGEGVPISMVDQGMADTAEIWSNLLLGLAARDEGEALICPACGWTYASFEEKDQLGCPECYQTFAGEMQRLLKEYHGDNVHMGKIPYSRLIQLDRKRRLQAVKEQIHKAVQEQRFEDAALMRDEIRDLEREMGRRDREGEEA